jgi:hypothetical protein
VGAAVNKNALKVAALVLAVAAVGAVASAVLRGHGGGDGPSRFPERAVPSLRPGYGTKPGGDHFGALGELLLPIPKGYRPGPDADEYGGDYEFTGAQARKHMDDAYDDLPAKQREAFRRNIAALDIQGMGVRTYRPADGRLVVETVLIKMNKGKARGIASLQNALYGQLGVLRKGPAIHGHPGAHCFLLPATAHGKLGEMFCFAAEGDLTTIMHASGPAPLRKAEAATLLRKQLDRIKDPGEIT